MEKPKMTEAERKYDRTNKKRNTIPIYFRLYKSTDQDLIEYLEKVENKQGLIKRLLREHMNKGSE